jgi:hypothetical protein
MDFRAEHQVQSRSLGVTPSAERSSMAIVVLLYATIRRSKEESEIYDISRKHHEDAGSKDWNDYTGGI